MAYRFTNTEKWSDAWFSGLKQIEMLLFVYLCDNCDIAGFIELNIKRWSNDLNSSNETIEGALKGLARGLIVSKSNDCIFLRNFLKHQKNLPLNENNKAHLGILKRFEIYKQKFDIENINEFIEGASKGLASPLGIGNGKGNDNGNGNETPKPEFDFSLFLNCEVELLKTWIDYRKKIKKPLTQHGINLMKKDFTKYGYEKMKLALESSIKNSYQGYDFFFKSEKSHTNNFVQPEGHTVIVSHKF